MEGIKTNIDRLFDQFASDSLAYNVPRRQSSNFNTSAVAATGGTAASTPLHQECLSAAKLAKKRKLSDQEASNNHSLSHNSTATIGRSSLSLPDDSLASASDANRSQNSLLNISNASQASVQFEMRRLRADVLDFTTKVCLKHIYTMYGFVF